MFDSRLEMKGLSVGYKVEWHDPWEPFFIAEKKSVHYDERFKQVTYDHIVNIKPRFETRWRHMSIAVACSGTIQLPVLDHAL